MLKNIFKCRFLTLLTGKLGIFVFIKIVLYQYCKMFIRSIILLNNFYWTTYLDIYIFKQNYILKFPKTRLINLTSIFAGIDAFNQTVYLSSFSFLIE